MQFNIIVARCANNGIGYKGDLPWSLRKELQYFSDMTKTVKDPAKKNAVIMGRKTWDSLPPKWQPLPGRINFVLSSQQITLKDAILCSDFEDLLKKINAPEYKNVIETAWVIGGAKVYHGALDHKICNRLYVTDILKEFECDTFLKKTFTDGFREISFCEGDLLHTQIESIKVKNCMHSNGDDRVPEEIQEENGIQYKFRVYDKLP